MPQDPTSAPDIHRAIAELGRLTDLVLERRRQLARQAGVSEAQWRLLEEIAEEDFMPSLFAKRRSCSPAGVSRTLRQLLERGLVTAEISPDDARQRLYRLTPSGRGVLEDLRAHRAQAIAAIWEGLPREQVEGFVRFSEALSGSLEAYVRAAD